MLRGGGIVELWALAVQYICAAAGAAAVGAAQPNSWAKYSFFAQQKPFMSHSALISPYSSLAFAGILSS